MSYFFQRLITFVTVSVVVLFLAPNLFSSNRHLAGWGPVLFILVAFSVIYLIVFGVSELIRRLASNWISTGSNIIRDTLLAMSFLMGCALFLFAPRPKSFSFGDNIGAIISDGKLTPHGWQVQSEAFVQCVLIAALFWIISRAKFLNQ
jgi:cell division protein FtsW (lipid II flippase)